MLITTNQILEIEGEEGQFEYLIDYGKKVNCLPENDKNENNLMSGCLAKVWLKTYKKMIEITLKEIVML